MPDTALSLTVFGPLLVGLVVAGGQGRAVLAAGATFVAQLVLLVLVGWYLERGDR